MKSYFTNVNDKGILTFTINRAEKRNAVNYDVMDGLQEVLQQAQRPEIKLLVITGTGEDAFCSGGDLSVFHALKTEQEAYAMLSRMARILYELSVIPIPTVALLNGTAVGGGCELATACDFRIGHKNIRAGFVQGKLAITTGWGGGTWLLEKLPYSSAMKLLMEAKLYNSEELLELGFLNYIYEGNSIEGLEMFLENISLIERNVLIAYKEIAIRKWSEGNIREKIEAEIRRCSVLWESDAHHKQVDRFMDRK